MEFNNAQREAVNHFKGAAMVLAGPGSGKTTVITHRIKELIRKDVSPEKILVVTFTKAAAVHMQRKIFSDNGRRTLGKKQLSCVLWNFSWNLF